MVSGGTLATLATEIAKALAPLETRLSAGNANTLFVELGLNLPSALIGEASVASALGNVTSAVGTLAPLISQLATAISAGDTGQRSEERRVGKECS